MEALLTLAIAALILGPLIALINLFVRVRELEVRLRELRSMIPPIVKTTISTPEPSPGGKPPAIMTPPGDLKPAHVPREALPRDIHNQPTIVGPDPLITAPKPPPPPPVPSRTKEEWEALVGGKLLNRIGALALIIGMGFFLQYAFEHNWINETARVLIGAAIGGALLVGAARTHTRGFQVFAQGLVGAGIAILYLSVYASFNFYHLVPQMVAFALMTVVTGIAFVQAFKYNSLAVALLAWLGGFLTPILLSTGVSDELGLFTYIALLDAGILIISLRKTAWTVLEPLALGATWLLYLLWYSSDYTSESLSLTLYFVIVFWGLFHALSTGKALKNEPTYRELRQAAVVANAFFTFLALYALVNKDYHDWMGPVTALMAVLYAVTAWVLIRRTESQPGWVTLHGVLAALGIITATAIHYTGYTTVSLWSIEALILAYLGKRWQRQAPTWLSVGLFLIAVFKLAVTRGAIVPLQGEESAVLLNWRAGTYIILGVTAWIGSGMFRHLPGRSSTALTNILSYGSLAVLGSMLTVETIALFGRMIQASTVHEIDLLEFYRWLALAAVWSTYGTILTVTGMTWGRRPSYVAGLLWLLLGIAAAMLRGMAFDPVTSFIPIMNWRLVTLVAVCMEGFIIVRNLDRPTEHIPWRTDIFAALRLMLVVLLLVLVTAETRDYFENAIALAPARSKEINVTGELSRLENLKQLSLSGVWLVSSIALMALGIWRRTRSLRVASIILFGFTIVKIFVYDLSFLDTLYRIFSFIGLGVILLGVSYAYQRYKGLIFGPEDQTPTPPSPST